MKRRSENSLLLNPSAMSARTSKHQFVNPAAFSLVLVLGFGGVVSLDLHTVARQSLGE
jgi:hypothetical protein